MLKNPFHRSKRSAFIKSSMKKFKTQFKLLERENDQHVSTQQESFVTNEEDAGNSTLNIPTNEPHYRCMRILYDDQEGWTDELDQEVEIFYDCEEEIESSEAHTICKREDEVVRDSPNIVENSPSKNLQEAGVITNSPNEETTSSQVAEKIDSIVKDGAAPGIIMKKESNFYGRIFILGVVFVVLFYVSSFVL